MSLNQINQDTKSSLLVGRTESGVMLKDSSQESNLNWLWRLFSKSYRSHNKSNRHPDSITSKLDQVVRVEFAPKTSRQDSNSCSGGGTEKDVTHGTYQARPEEESVDIRSSKGFLIPGGNNISCLLNTSPLGEVTEVEVVLECRGEDSNTSLLGKETEIEVLLEHSSIDHITSSLGEWTEIVVVPVTDRSSLASAVYATVLGVSAALALATLAILIVYCVTGQGSQINSPPEVCINAFGMSWPTPETEHLLKKLERRTVNGVPQVCAETQDQLTAVMELAMTPRTDKSETNMIQENSQTFTPVSAHKLLLAPVTENNIKEPTVIHKVNNALLKSATDNAPSEHAHGINVTNDSLLIRLQGLYYVYFGVHFQPVSDKPPREFEYQRSTAYVYRKSPNGQKQSNLLLQIAHSLCDNCTNNQETSFAAGSFYLEAGDHIQMSYSCLGMVKFNTGSTFLGLMMIDSEHRRNNWF